jgi:hypothetical protein
MYHLLFKGKSNLGDISRIYNFINYKNGRLGSEYFFNNYLLKKKIIIKKNNFVSIPCSSGNCGGLGLGGGGLGGGGLGGGGLGGGGLGGGGLGGGGLGGGGLMNGGSGKLTAELLLFYDNNSSYSMQAMNIWNQLKIEFDKTQFNGYALSFKEYDSSSPYLNTYNIQGTPTIKLIRNGIILNYNNLITNDNIINFLNDSL